LNIVLFDVNKLGALHRAIVEGLIERAFAFDTYLIHRQWQGRSWRVMEMDMPRARELGEPRAASMYSASALELATAWLKFTQWMGNRQK
jgi:hypothetical protein